MNITALMPCRGRLEQTKDLIPRLFDTAGLPFDLVCIVDGDQEVRAGLVNLWSQRRFSVFVNEERLGYWPSLRDGMKLSSSELVVNLANDLLPGLDWLKRAYDAYLSLYGEGEGMIGFNDGIHIGEQAAHFMIARSLLRRWYGEDYFPLCYHHLYGDAEISRRARDEGRFAVAQWAVLYHNHFYTGGATDRVYAEGQAQAKKDEDMYARRSRNGWTL